MMACPVSFPALLHLPPMTASLENELQSSCLVSQKQQSSQHQSVADFPWPVTKFCDFSQWSQGMGQHEGFNLMQVPCSQHCLNYKEEGIMINMYLLAQMQSVHLPELT